MIVKKLRKGESERRMEGMKVGTRESNEWAWH